MEGEGELGNGYCSEGESPSKKYWLALLLAFFLFSVSAVFLFGGITVAFHRANG